MAIIDRFTDARRRMAVVSGGKRKQHKRFIRADRDPGDVNPRSRDLARYIHRRICQAKPVHIPALNGAQWGDVLAVLARLRASGRPRPVLNRSGPDLPS